jgi:dTDP-glucose 4,6-dehydratase
VKFFITGGAGFIGSNFVNFLFKSDLNFDKITVFDKFTYAANLKNLSAHQSNPMLKVVKGDITDSKLLYHEMQDHDVVIHFAAESHVDRSISSAEEFIKSNVMGTHNVLEGVRINNVRTMIHISTDEVYGTILDGSADELHPLLPNSPYASSKASSDLVARSFHQTHGVDVRITRCCNNFGKYQHPEKMIPVVINSILKQKKIPIYGDGSNVREWIHVEDHCKGILEVLKNGNPGEIYNIGTGIRMSNLDLATLILQLMGESMDKISFVADRQGHDFRYSLNSEKIRNLGFAPSIDLDGQLKSAIDWYKHNVNYWET